MSEPADFLFITRKWAPAMGGMETWSHKVAEHLGKRTNVQIVALPGRANGMPPSLTALLLFPFTALLRYCTLSFTPKTILIGDAAIWPLALLAKLRRGSPRLLIAAHGTDVAYPRRGGFKGTLYGVYLSMGARLLRDATVVANSRATADVATQAGWSNTVVVPLATDLRPISVHGQQDLSILFAGRLLRHKGCRWFVENVLDQLPEHINLKIAGTSWDKDEQAILSHPRVNFLGKLTQDDLTRAYAQALCVILPNIETENGEQEGFGLVAAEAAAVGGLVLASDHGGLRDAVIDGTTGHLIPAGNAQAWATAILRITKMSSAERAEFIEKATEKACSYYNWDRVATSIQRLGQLND